jgi:uncharacterized YkwD family protein
VSFQLRGQRPGYLASILLLTLCLTLGFAGTALGADNAVAMTSEEAQVVELINQARCDAGLAPLKVEPKLSALARIKAQDMASNRYLSHTSPTYGTQREMMQAAAMGFVYAGENIAKAPTISSGCKALYYSGAARAKLLSTNYDQLGVGIAPCGSYKIIVQMFAGGMQATVSNPPKEAAPAAPAPAPAEPSDGLNADEQAMLNLVNQERVKAGLNPLQSDPTLVKLARMKAQDMIDKGYFSHTSPTYGSPFDLLRANGVTYSYAGENLAGAGSTSSAHTNLMNSAGHRANILNGNYTKVGIGVVSGGPYGKMFVQLFIAGQVKVFNREFNMIVILRFGSRNIHKSCKFYVVLERVDRLIRLKGNVGHLQGEGSFHNNLVRNDADISYFGISGFGENFVYIRLRIRHFYLSPDNGLDSIFTLDQIDFKPFGSSHFYSSFQNLSILIYEGD